MIMMVIMMMMIVPRGRNIVSISKDGTARLWSCGDQKWVMMNIKERAKKSAIYYKFWNTPLIALCITVWFCHYLPCSLLCVSSCLGCITQMIVIMVIIIF